MANHIRQVIAAACAALVFGGAAAQERPFSHRLHLDLKLECLTCHPGAAASTTAADNNLPERAVCLRCHQEAVVKTPEPLLVSKFNHALHLKFGNIAPVIAKAIDAGSYLSPVPAELRKQLDAAGSACTTCHRGLDRSEAVSKAAFPQMADCLVCHNRVDPPFSCTKCHSADARLKPASHTADYIDVHSTGKANLDKASCIVCHGRRFTCLGCH